MARLRPLAVRRWKRRDRKKENERPTLAKPKPARMGHPTPAKRDPSAAVGMTAGEDEKEWCWEVLGDEDGAGAVVEAVDGEIAAVDGEYFAEALSFGDADEGGVGEVHGAVGVFTHELAGSGDVARIEGKQKDGAALEHFPEGLLRSRLVGQKVHGFDERRPDGGERLAQGLESRNALGMVLVIRIDQGNEGPGIDENQERFPRCLRSAAKRRPVCSERLGFPPRTIPMRSIIAS